VNGNAWTIEEEVRLSEYIVERVCSKASGRNEDECRYNYPRDVYFIGNLRPIEREGDVLPDQPTYLRELLNKLAPVAFGAEFRLRPEQAEVEIRVKLCWACYYRIFPTYEDQRRHQLQGALETENNPDEGTETTVGRERGAVLSQSEDLGEGEDFDATLESDEEKAELEAPDGSMSARDRRRQRRPQDSLFIRFRKIPCHVIGRIIIRRGIDGELSADISDLERALNQETSRAQQIVENDPESVRAQGSLYSVIRVPEMAVSSEVSYIAFLQSLQTEIIPQWQWEVRAEVRSVEGLGEVALEFVNSSPMPPNSPNTEAFLFDTQATFIFIGGQVVPFELNLAPRGFRYDRNLWGRGFNCAIEPIGSPPSTYVTTHWPIYRQQRYTTRTTASATFADLSRDPSPTLGAILDAMEDYLQVWDQARNRYTKGDPDWEAEFGAEFDGDRQKFEEEISIFRRGYQLIREDPDVCLAFQLTNETFQRGDPRKTGWRLFQIVFIVSQITSIAALIDAYQNELAEREMVDIIYFPTGGGKTEAYLGVLVFHCFFDRLRGKSAGVTAWTRFPLRLLTLQQTQRVADVVGMAELIRREQRDPRLNQEGVDGFAVGYFVGAEATPNEITPPRDDLPDPIWSQANDPAARQRWKRVVYCPSCRTTNVQMDFDPDKVRLIHRCNNPGCAFPEGIIPVYVVDNEIYRYLPSIIVGTIDKLAGLGNQRKLSQVFGQVDGRCVIHGYYKRKCCQKNCTDPRRLQPRIPRGLSGPTLFIQDELHLLKEGLGTFDGHYETFVQRLRQEFGQTDPLKIIASSATIEAFARQVEHLYGREQTLSRIFPSPGPTLGQSFYAETLNYPQRLFVGILPHNKTIFNTILELIEYYHREIQYLQRMSAGKLNPYGGALLPGTIEFTSILDRYATSLTYFLANRELNSIRTDLEGDVNPNLSRDRLQQLIIQELTGSTSTDEVTRILEKLERPAGPQAPPDAILATSMISHGVDVNRLNSMIFYGMPRQNAEYIQASSRVGRESIGIIFSCLHPARERDQSHYTYFIKFHEFLGQLVEPVAINRWSKFSIGRTLPGLFMGILLQSIANSSGETNPNRYYVLDFVRKKITEGSLRPDQFIPFLEEAYQVQGASTGGRLSFRQEISLRVGQFLDQIISASPGSNYVSDALIPRPMRSLRDVDDPIEIELDSTGTLWALRAGR
jgi:hypothetical protein